MIKSQSNVLRAFPEPRGSFSVAGLAEQLDMVALTVNDDDARLIRTVQDWLNAVDDWDTARLAALRSDTVAPERNSSTGRVASGEQYETLAGHVLALRKLLAEAPGFPVLAGSQHAAAFDDWQAWWKRRTELLDETRSDTVAQPDEPELDAAVTLGIFMTARMRTYEDFSAWYFEQFGAARPRSVAQTSDTERREQ